MGNQRINLISFFLLLVCLNYGALVEGGGRHRHRHYSNKKKLFVFGDSYTDSGNLVKAFASSWKEPYGVTFPGKPTGRFSDGRVLTDFLAAMVGTRSPIPFKWRKINPKLLQYGMNFAYGGTGVFDTLVPAPNLTAQIDLFQGMINEGAFNISDVQSSVALIAVAGNDYTAFEAQNGTIEKVRPFTESLIRQFASDVKRLQAIGVRQTVVTAIEPMGCLPANTLLWSHKKCNNSLNMVSNLHNFLLKQAVEGINNATGRNTVAIFDMYQAFMSIIQNPQGQASLKFQNPLRPCCEGVSPEFSCGSVDSNMTKMYTVCEDPKSVLFWDRVHPSQGGWSAMSSHMQSTLAQLC